MKEKVSVLINSCDKHKSAWNPFFTFFKKNWLTCPYKIYLNTESSIYQDDSLKITMLHCSNKVSWSKRLKKALKRIKSKYIIFLLEDFFLLEEVNQKELDRAISIMDSDSKISVIDFEYVERIKAYQTHFDGYEERERSAMYFLNCQAALWRRKDLIRFLSPYEDPWQFEVYGSNRAKLYNRKFLRRSIDTPKVFVYDIQPESGYGLYGGKWLEANKILFSQYGIEVDFKELGFGESKRGILRCQPPKKTVKEKWLYLLYGGGEKVRMGLWEQLLLLFRSPREGAAVLKNKLTFLRNK